MKTKKEYREFAKKERSGLDIENISKKICCILKNQDFYRFSKNVLSFYPFNSEIDLRELYKDTAKNWFLPRVEMETRSLIINAYSDGDILVKNKWGVSEPCCDLEPVDPKEIDLTIIPALMADKQGQRLGYGAGFYDRFIPGLRKDCIKIIPIPEKLFVESIPHDHWDIPVNKVITENNIYNIN